ncbi:hypothetical protein HNQ91_002015 [Filimonas zeae]|uniref:DUF5675 domain-containing protein n=1 Tax=Filimonas zeae TaxID=1737353 RepID=A0A917IWG6_9BACT|nr:DUF5675 family protein [Filimonas zeae]MDR6338964.1 hypothetical protein [Filimonas zeae]GGH65750.1 hypothetical protein GCM10011379_19220 [Filimonas zeae]
MELLITRTYYKNGTNGTLMLNGKPFCFTIELPDKNNQTKISCIPEGSYKIKKRNSENHGDHLLITGVPKRSHILIHPANNAMAELEGCISPVTTLTAPGCGNLSRAPFVKLLKIVYAALAKKEEVWLRIISQQETLSEKQLLNAKNTP